MARDKQSKDGVEVVPKQEVKNKFRSNKPIFETSNSHRKSNFDAFLSFFLSIITKNSKSLDRTPSLLVLDKFIAYGIGGTYTIKVLNNAKLFNSFWSPL